MRGYLLGLLPEREAAALEQQYFTDDDCFRRMQEEENALIEDYLDGTLGLHEHELFVNRYFAVSELQRKVDEIRKKRSAAPQPVRRMSWFVWRAAAAFTLALVLAFALAAYHRRQAPNGGPSAQAEAPKQQSAPAAISSEKQAEPQPSQTKAETRPRSRQNTEVKRGRRVAQAEVPSKLSDSPKTADVAHSPDVEEKPASAEAVVNNLPGPTVGKKRIAVLDFDYGTVQQYVYGIYGSNQDVGKGITNMLVEKLVNDGKYEVVVVERRNLNEVLEQQELYDHARANPATAQGFGKLLGVDAVIIGSITKFGRDDHSKAIGGAGFGRAGFGIVGSVKKSKAVCAISARLIDTTTGEILAAVTGEGESTRSGTSLIGANTGGGFDTHNSNFGQTLLGEAVTNAVSDVSAKLSSASVGAPTITAAVETGARPAADPNDPHSWHAPGIYVYAPDGSTGKMIRLEPTVYSLGKSGGQFSATMSYGIAKVNWKAVVRNAHANIKIANSDAEFYFYFSQNDHGLPTSEAAEASTPNDFTLLKFDEHSDSRDAIFMISNSPGGPTRTDEHSNVPFKFKKVKAGVYKVTVQSPLAPGEYCFISNGFDGAPASGTAQTNQLYDFSVSRP